MLVLVRSCVALALLCLGAHAFADPKQETLRAPESFDEIRDRVVRSRTLFVEASRVMLSPRCLNCHPRGDSPYQGENHEIHYPHVTRGPQDKGVPGMTCAGCHQDRNLEMARVPGAPNWHLAPKVMAWEGFTPAKLCAQLKDPKRNGNRTLAQIVDHSKHDELVSWGWAPGWGRVPAPGTQERFGALMAAWVDTGAECPPEVNK